MIDDFSSAAIMFTAGVVLTMLMYSWLTPDYDEIIAGHHADLLEINMDQELALNELTAESHTLKVTLNKKTQTILSEQAEITRLRKQVTHLENILDEKIL